MNDKTRVASDHLLHSTPADYDLNAEFVSDLLRDRAVAIVEALERAAAPTMTMDEVLAARSAAGVCDADEMRRTMQEATEKARRDWNDIKGDLAL